MFAPPRAWNSRLRSAGENLPRRDLVKFNLVPLLSCPRHTLRLLTIALLFPLGLGTPNASAETTRFCDPMQSAEEIQLRGGHIYGWGIYGDPTFAPGVYGNGICLDGYDYSPERDDSIAYTKDLFNAASGSLLLWFKRTSDNERGGIAQIGMLNTINSLGIFYVDYDDLFFEIRNSADHYEQVELYDALPLDTYVHIGVTWDTSQTPAVMKLYLNGVPRGREELPGTYDQTSRKMDIGTVGQTADFYGYAVGCVDELAFFDHVLDDGEVHHEYLQRSCTGAVPALSRSGLVATTLLIAAFGATALLWWRNRQAAGRGR